MTDLAFQRCIHPSCAATYDVGEVRTSCGECGGLLDVLYDWDAAQVPKSLTAFEQKWSRRHDPLCLSGVWRFRDGLIRRVKRETALREIARAFLSGAGMTIPGELARVTGL